MSFKPIRPFAGPSYNRCTVNRFTVLSAIVLTISSLSLTSQSVSADVYRWVEADGTVNYGERVPRNRDYTVISRSTPAPKGARNSVRQTRQPVAQAQQAPQSYGPTQPTKDNMTDKQRAMLERLEEAEQVRQDEIAKIRQANCETSKRLLNKMQSNGRVRKRAEDGEQTIMGEDERQRYITEAQESIALNCDSLS